MFDSSGGTVATCSLSADASFIARAPDLLREVDALTAENEQLAGLKKKTEVEIDRLKSEIERLRLK